MTNNLVLRVAGVDDGSALARMRWEFHVEDGEHPPTVPYPQFADRFAAFFVDAVSSGRWVVWVAELGAELVSHIDVYVVPKVPRPIQTSDAWGYVTNVFTVLPHRDRGFGSALMRAVIEWAERQQLELLLVWPSVRSVPFYERGGFAKGGEVMERVIVGE